jgi:glutamate synthase (NADPH/NADH) large chain
VDFPVTFPVTAAAADVVDGRTLVPYSHAFPPPEGLYDPRHEKDACGVAFVATLTGEASHDIVAKALTALRNLEHRGAAGAEPNSGDGAGILMQVPDAFLRAVTAEQGLTLPAAGSYAVGTAFVPGDEGQVAKTRARIEEIAAEESLTVLGWREVPVNPDILGTMARSVMPTFVQLFVQAAGGPLNGMDLERLAFCLRKRAEHETDAYFPSLSSRTLAYKGMLTTDQLDSFFPDLVDERMASAIGVVHSRFSTNTFPSWPLSHPFRFIAHNGEINTVMGNRNWMRAREALLASDSIPGDLERLFPICTPGASDSASFDEVLELLHMGGRSLPHAVLMMIPEAWENHAEMDEKRRDFYRFHSATMEPWDGPACVVFTDGTQIGAVLDRNGLRPSRFWVTDDGLVVLASEVGVLDLDPATVVRKGRLQPGRMFLVDTEEHRIIEDEEIKDQLAGEHPYGEWLHGGIIHLDDIPEREHIVHTHASVTRRQQIFGYTEEELRVILTPMANTGGEALGSMGTDSPIAALSEKPRLLFDYFSQLFAQVTNPPLDAIREELVTSLNGTIGPEANLLEPGPASCRQIVVPFPVISNDDLVKIRQLNRDGDHPGFETHVARGLYDVNGGGAAMAAKIDEICAEVSAAIAGGARIIVLSDRHATADLAPIPSLLLTGAVHHHLVREKTRTQVGLLVEAGDVREVHHVALLVGYGAAAVNPYLAMESVEDLAREGYYVKTEPEQAVKNLIKALGKGVVKVMSKIGVSTVASYTGAQIFECIGLSQTVVDRYFTGTTSKLGGVELDAIAQEVAARHAKAYPPAGIAPAHRELEIGGEYQWRREGEPHLFNPETVFRLQHSTRTGRYDIFKQYTKAVDDQSEKLMTLRGLFKFKDAEAVGRTPIPLDEVEPVSEIVKRFSTGAMSYGSISREAHETLAIAMNRLGAKSNTGEGGEDPERLYDPERRSAIKQVASGRFGVTSEYLTNADDIQIKMAQGAKPGEGGQLPGNKVYPWVAKTRHSTPGVGLISPPPHHDIYSIEDLAQLIHDLKNANPSARVHVKLVSEVGVGTVAAGVSKAHADVVLISGHDGGTGASPLTSLKHAGGPWELGLAADAAPQRPARPDRRPDRRPAQDRPRRRHRGAARRRGVRLRDRPAGGLGLHPDAGLPPRHLPGGRGDAEPGAARAVQRQGRVRRELLRVHRRGGPRAARRARIPQHRRGGRPGRDPRHARRRHPLEGAGPRPGADPAQGRRRGDALPRPGPAQHRRPGPRARQVARRHRDPAPRGLGDRDRRAGAGPAGDPQRPPHRRHDPRPRGHQEARRRGPARRHDRPDLRRLRRPVVRRVRPQGHHAAARGRRQRLRRQGALRRPDRDPSRPGGDLPRRRAHHRRQHHRLRRDLG